MTEPLHFSVADPAFLADPFPFYRRLREEAPVHWSPELHAWLISRFEDVERLLTDEHVTADQKAWAGYAEIEQAAGELPNLRWALDETLLLCNGARHLRRRRFANEPFAPPGCRRIAAVTAEVVSEVLATFAGRREIELFEDFCAPVRVRVMSRLIGPPFTRDQERYLVKATNDALGFLEPTLDRALLARHDAALRAFRDFVTDLVARGIRAGVRDCMLADLMAPNKAGERLDEDEIVALVFSFLLAGTEANGSLITMGTLLLMEHPDQLRLLLDEPERFPDAIREILRYRSFTKFLPRYVQEDFELRGQRLRRGEIVLLLFQSAFRDPAAFDHPDVFDVRRGKTRELAFGAGPHQCVGQRMAEIEGAIALRELFRRHPTATLRDGQAAWAKHHMMVAVPNTVPIIPVVLC